MAGTERDDEETERPRPRVVDKRVSAGGHSPPARPRPDPAAAPSEPVVDDVAEAPAAGRDAPSDEQVQAIAEEMARTPSRDWILNVAITLANVAGTKLDRGDLEDARLAIDALAGLVGSVGPALGEADTALRQTLAQLQLGYAQLSGTAGPA